MRRIITLIFCFFINHLLNAEENIFQEIKQDAQIQSNKYTMVYFVTNNDTPTFNLLASVIASNHEKLNIVIIGDTTKKFTKDIVTLLTPNYLIQDNFYCSNPKNKNIKKLFLEKMNAVLNEDDFISIQPNGAIFILDCKGKQIARFYQDYWNVELMPLIQHLKPICD